MATQGHRLSAIAAALGAQFAADGDDPLMEHLAIDSRKPFPAESTLFVALAGERHDAHRYIPGLVERGVRHFLVNAGTDIELPPGALRVPDTLVALQHLAGWHRAHFHAPVIGITGSNGKTVAKEWLFQLLRGKEHIVRSPGSWNSQVGVPLSVWEMGPEHTLGLFEAGISKPGEMMRLHSVIRPTLGIFTNVGPSHSENFRSDAEKAIEKVQLFRDAEVLVYCADHTLISDALRTTGLSQRLELRTWSRKGPAWLHVVHEEIVGARTRISVINADRQFTFDVPFLDHASVENALHCVTMLLHLGNTPEWITEHTPHLAPVAMRLEVVDGTHGITLINDAYSNDEASLTIALDHLGMVAHGRPKAAVLSDIVGSGEPPGPLYRRIADRLLRAGVGPVIGIGPQLTAHHALFPASSRFFDNTSAALQAIDPVSMANHTVLVKGARTFALEQLVERWQRQVHGTVLEIDLAAIRHNLNHYRALLTPPTRTMAMVKAFGYGTGALELARLFAHEQVHYLGVAYADEGIELRQNGIRLPILVMNPEPVPFDLLHRFRLEAEVYDMRSLEEAIRMADQHSDATPVHLKLDTGMRRLGFLPAEIPALLERLKAKGSLRIASVLSHLAASENPEHDAFTREQVRSFQQMATAIGDVIGSMPLRHIANSAAIARFPEARMDMVRLGIGLHGIGANDEESSQLLPAATLRSPIAQIKDLAAGETVGYGRSWSAPRASRIATLPIGYADGLSRRLGNGVGRVWIHGKPAPILGTVCMDMCMVDITDIDCTLNDTVIIFDPEHPVAELAQAMGTIPYEVLTSIAQRVKRMYIHE